MYRVRIMGKICQQEGWQAEEVSIISSSPGHD
jgi:hypothetical protein